MKKILIYILFFIVSLYGKTKYSIFLENPLFSYRTNNIIGPLSLQIYSENEKFEKFFIGDCLNYNTSFCIGKIENYEKIRETYRLILKIFYLPDAWVHGGKGEYKLEFEIRNGKIDGKYEGIYLPFKNSGFSSLLPDLEIFENDGKFIKVNGKVYGETTDEKNFDIYKNHPRLLVSQAEFNKLKKRLESDFGKNFYNKFLESNDAVVNGFMYFLTKDKKYALKSKELVEKNMNDFTPGPFNLGHAHGERLRRISLTYDFCYDGWDEEFKNRVETYIRYLSERILLRPSSLSNKVNTHPASNYSAKLNPGAFIGAMTLIGEKLEKLPDLISPQIIEIKPLSINIEKVNFLKFESLKMPDKWLFMGPFEYFSPFYDKNFYKNSLDFSYIEKFIALDEKYLRKKDGIVQSIDILGPINRKYLCCAYYLTGIENDKERFIKTNLLGSGEIYVNFQKVTTNDVLKLQKGKYIVIIKIFNALVYPWGQSSFSFNFEEISEEISKDFINRKTKLYKLAEEYYEIFREIYLEKEKENPFIYILFEIGKKRMEEYASLGLGKWGFNTEGDGYTHYSCDEPMIAATIYKKLTGNEFNKFNTLGKMPITIFAMSLFNGKFEKISFGGGSNIISSRHLSRIFPVVPEEYKPGLLWFWDKLVKKNIKEEIKDSDIPVVQDSDEELLYTFINYPEGIKTVHPEENFPKVISDDFKGGFIFRNKYQNENDIIFAIFGKSLPVRPCWQMNNAGDFRLWGLGEKWFIQGASDKNLISSIYQNVVQIQNREQNGLGGKIIHFKNEGDSGIVSFDLTDTYRLPKEEKVEIRDRYGNKIEESLKEENIKIIRSFGIDFTKLSGVDGLFVIVDYLKIPGEKLWQAVTGPELDVKIEGNEVSILSKKTTATLKCYFFPKQEISIQWENEINFGGKKYAPFKGKQKILGVKTNGEIIFTIMTLQKGNPPEIKLDWKGVRTNFLIGKRKMTFDGEKIIFDNL